MKPKETGGRPSADEMLDRVRKEAGAGARGRHRVYLGIAPGVGKTFAALEELHRRKARGTDVAIGFVETHNRPRTAELIGDLDVVPRRRITYRGATVEEMDTAAVRRRQPAVTLVDELAHTNVPGSRHLKRYQDALELKALGMDVISTVNVQHLVSLQDTVLLLTGVRVTETLPDWVVDAADEVEMIDQSPEALRKRMRHGNVYARHQVEPALRDNGRLSLEDRLLLLAFANQLAIAAQRGTFAEQEARARALEESDRLKSALVSSVSHELKTPLAAIKTSATALMQATNGTAAAGRVAGATRGRRRRGCPGPVRRASRS